MFGFIKIWFFFIFKKIFLKIFLAPFYIHPCRWTLCLMYLPTSDDQQTLTKPHEENCFQPLSGSPPVYICVCVISVSVIKVNPFCCKLLEQEWNIPTCKSTKERDLTNFVKISTSITEHFHLKTRIFQGSKHEKVFSSWLGEKRKITRAGIIIHKSKKERKKGLYFLCREHFSSPLL